MAARDEVDRNRSSYPPMFSANCRPGMARESEGRRRHLDYGEAQSFQDLPLCRFLRLIGDELDAGLAGSSGISVEDFQTHPHAPWVLAPIEHAGKIRSRIASETTYGRSAEATASRTWAPAETPEASTVYKMPWWGMLIPGSAAAPQPPELRAALAPSFQPEPGDPLQGLRLTKDRHAQIDAGFEHIGRTEFCRNAVCPPVVRVVEVMLKLAILDVPDFYSVLTNHTGCRLPLAHPAGRQNRGLLFLDAGHTATGWGGLSTGGGGIGLGGSSIGGR